ncbi:hypothetical protein N5P37_011728 [Trichoderma harzianum]|uniref:NAD-dependent epimerase/dehydratase domain-containing protein n=1 Tax=Trichoderma harzianum CBS 226.95 TaxID=983964 RepID=A0A2T3ZRD5_TRIHA|nr:hypothetical protein M431DRAFT_22015 [Trichoderma harzianum CBS 226.95]KAK0755719.1 hypothetical protein N5P37_011728 [Trichoderma harzianum]PTB47332.1 hypothetical protein M431DRAFT_22015 [Trichoderma harzianum CBS 226.95]
MKSQVFVLGPGYVGRAIIDLLHSEGKYEITTLVRTEKALKDLSDDGANTVLGSLDDTNLIEQLAAQSDVVFHTATSDHLASAQAILRGIAKRASQGKHTIYLHQSGASCLSDQSAGNNPNNEVYSDSTTAQIDTLSPTAPHRKIDLAIVEERQKLGSLARIFIWMPPIIYGNNGKHKRISIQIPALTRFALKNGHAGYVGTGKNAWSFIHVLDLAKAYTQVLHWLETAPRSDLGLQNPYFFCESGEISWADVASMIGKNLYRAGRIVSPEPHVISDSEYVDLFGKYTPDIVGCNSRSSADRLRLMGWKPEQPDVQEAFEKEDLPLILLESGKFEPPNITLS